MRPHVSRARGCWRAELEPVRSAGIVKRGPQGYHRRGVDHNRPEPGAMAKLPVVPVIVRFLRTVLNYNLDTTFEKLNAFSTF